MSRILRKKRKKRPKKRPRKRKRRRRKRSGKLLYRMRTLEAFVFQA